MLWKNQPQRIGRIGINLLILWEQMHGRKCGESALRLCVDSEKIDECGFQGRRLYTVKARLHDVSNWDCRLL